MGNKYYSLNRAEEGFKESDFTTGTSSTAGDAIELRVSDAASLTKKDVVKALDAFRHYFTSKRATFPNQ